MRNLEIRPGTHSYKIQYLIAAVSGLLAVGMLWVIWYRNGTEDFSLVHLVQLFAFAFLAVESVSRVRFLKSLFLRIDAEGISWRLVVGLEILNRRPPNSSASLRWDEISAIRQEATELRISIHGVKDDLQLPLSQFNYAQRQNIKAAVEAHFTIVNTDTHDPAIA